MDQPLPCIVCGVQPEPVFREPPTMQPYGATMFDAGSGHYGSTVWDEMRPHVSLSINVCDPCLIAHKDRVAVVTSISRPEVSVEPWDPPSGTGQEV